MFGTYNGYQMEGSDTAPLVVKTQERGILASTRGILNVSENVKLIEYPMFLHDGNCLMTWWFS